MNSELTIDELDPKYYLLPGQGDRFKSLSGDGMN